MDRATEAACREELRRAGLLGQGTLARLLTLLRAAPESHLSLGQVLRMVDANKLAISSSECARQLEVLADHGLLRRLATTAAELVFDTETEPHSHLVYEETGQTIDLHVSRETLLAVIRQTLAEQSNIVEIMVRVRSISTSENATPPGH
jgi:Fe2+ or Zn2+ uptake regulation protein